jgi:hypothetical protein
MKHTLADAIHKLLPNAEFVITDNTLGGLEFIKPKNAITPTQAEVDSAIVELEAEATARVAAKAAAQAKLAALGLTVEDLQALGL